MDGINERSKPSPLGPGKTSPRDYAKETPVAVFLFDGDTLLGCATVTSAKMNVPIPPGSTATHMKMVYADGYIGQSTLDRERLRRRLAGQPV